MKTRACAKQAVRPKASSYSSLAIFAIDAISSITTTNRDDHDDDGEHGDDDNFLQSKDYDENLVVDMK